MKTTYELYMDNAGRLHLAILEDGSCIYYLCDTDHAFVTATLADLKNGSDPHDWDGGEDSPEEAYRWIVDAVDAHNGGAWPVEESDL